MELRKLTIGQLFDERVCLTPDTEFIGDGDRSITWAEAGELVNNLAAVYIRLGIKRGEHAAIWGVNSTEWIITYLALAKVGAVSVLVNTALKKSELEALTEENDIVYFICGKGKKGSLTTVAEEIRKEESSCVKKVFSMEEQFQAASTENDKEIVYETEKKISCHDVVSILFTSGTSGRAKGVMLTHYNLINNSGGIVEQMHWDKTDIMCTAVPLFHCFGITVGILGAVWSGASLRLVPYFGSTEVLAEIEKHKCTVFNGVPTFYLALVNSEDFFNYNTDSLKSGLMAGSPIIPTEYFKVLDKLKIAHLQTAFGQTESSPAITISDWDDSVAVKSDTSGKLMEHVELRIWDEKKKKAVCAGEKGEIQARGYLVMKGYYNKPAETKEAIDEEGWLHTGDCGYLDEQGYLHVTGRIKDIILRGGENISPAEIENIILQMPEVSQVKVVGVKVQVLQEEVAACIIWKDGCKCSDEQVKEFVKKRLADFKVPKFIYTFKVFPVNASGKVVTEGLKTAIREAEKKGGIIDEGCNKQV